MSVASRTIFVHSLGMTDLNTVQFKLNLPSALKKELEIIARRSNRSLSAEIISRLEVSLDMQVSPDKSGILNERLTIERERETLKTLISDLKEERKALIEATDKLTGKLLSMGAENR